MPNNASDDLVEQVRIATAECESLRDKLAAAEAEATRQFDCAVAAENAALFLYFIFLAVVATCMR